MIKCELSGPSDAEPVARDSTAESTFG